MGRVQHGTNPDDGGAPGPVPTVLDEVALSPRLLELTLDSAAVGRTMLRVLRPARFDEEPDRRWPVLILLHGGADDFRAWADSADVEVLTEPHDLLVVMPDSGFGATYVDWAFPGPDGRLPRYETHHLEEVPALLRSRFRADDRWVVAGLSAGGFGAMSYAARHPDRFRAAASFSGNLDTREDDVVGPLKSAAVTYSLEEAMPLGDPFDEEVRWRGHNPLDLAPNLAGLDLYVAGGNGRVGPLCPPDAARDPFIEPATEVRSRTFAARLGELGIPVTTNFYGDGTHRFPYWDRELRAALPLLLDALEGDRPMRTSFTHRRTDDAFEVWGWRFEVTGRVAPAFTDVRVDGDTVAATGNGMLHVTTPPRFPPGGRFVVGEEPCTADASGRLTFALDLHDTAERYTRDADPPGPRPLGPPTTVTIRPAPDS